MADISLRLPFNGNYPMTFGFGVTSENEDIKKKFTEWGIVGHNGIDYGLPEGTEVVVGADGKVVQSGDNGDFGVSVTIEHSWGQSLYAHLKETKVSQGQEVKTGGPIGLSGQTGSAFGEHLHFAIKPNDADTSNGYLGFIDPSPYFGKPEEKPQSPESPQSTQLPQSPLPAEVPMSIGTKEGIPPISPPSPQIIERVVEKEVIREIPVEKIVIKEVIKEVQVVNQEEIQKQVTERLKTEQDERRKLANEARTQKKKDNLDKILVFVREKKIVTNDDIRDFLRISQSTASNYLTELVISGKLKRQGERGATKYTA